MTPDSPLLPNPLYVAARRYPDAIAVHLHRGHMTYRELAEDVERTTLVLRNRGIGIGDRIGLLGPPTYAYLVNLLSLLELRAVACPLSDRLPRAAIDEAMHRIGGTKLLNPPGMSVAEAPSLPLHEQVAADQPFTLLFTSGSTGVPKVAQLTIGNHLHNAAGSNEVLPLEQGDSWLLSLPLYHVGGLAILFRSLLAGATIVLDKPRNSLGDQVLAHRVTHLSVVATQLQRMLDDVHLAAKIHSLKLVLAGGGPLTGELLHRARFAGLPVVASYGATESASQICTARLDGPPEEMRLLPYRELRIDRDGEILVRGPVLFDGYLDQQTIDPARDAEGWYHTGDSGSLQNDILTVTGRRDLMFISGGENIQPEEIERHLLDAPEVAEAIVVPLADAEFGYRPFAFLRMHGDAPLREEVIRRFLENRLPRFKVPVRMQELPAEPSEQGMKPDRQLLRRLANERPPP